MKKKKTIKDILKNITLDERWTIKLLSEYNGGVYHIGVDPYVESNSSAYYVEMKITFDENDNITHIEIL